MQFNEKMHKSLICETFLERPLSESLFVLKHPNLKLLIWTFY